MAKLRVPVIISATVDCIVENPDEVRDIMDAIVLARPVVQLVDKYGYTLDVTITSDAGVVELERKVLTK